MPIKLSKYSLEDLYLRMQKQVICMIITYKLGKDWMGK